MTAFVPGKIIYASTTNKTILKFGKQNPVILRPTREEAASLFEINLNKVSYL
jgi:hypothetical protein